jgi:hypothetical protein
MTPEQRRQFVLDHRTAIFGYNRAKDGPAMSIVFYCIAAPRCPYACSMSNGRPATFRSTAMR